MGEHDWFRRNSWTQDDRSEFFARLSRSRGQSNKAQYVRIQSVHLAEAGEIHGAIELLKKLFAEYPEKSQLAAGHMQMAKCLISLGQVDAALNEYRNALEEEKQLPNVRTGVWLEFPWFVVLHGMNHLYSEARRFLEWGDRQAVFPIDEYKLATVEAFMAADEGELDAARRFARVALLAAERTHSGFRYHAKLGLVDREQPIVRRRLEELAHA